MKFKHLLYAAAAAFGVVLTTACDDDMTEKLRSDARIEDFGNYVTAKSGKIYKTKISEDGHTILIKINPYVDAATELEGAVPTFYLSMGATISPSITEPQNFGDPDNLVEYTVTSADGKKVEKYYVSYTISDNIAFGEGFTNGEMTACKTYVELGYPGKYASWVVWEDIVDPLKGDLLVFPAFCGKDKVVLYSRRYAWGDDGVNDPKTKMTANPAHAFKVFYNETLEPAGELNLGGINIADVVATASDWKGNMVAAVGRKASGKTDFYYWTSPENAPVHVGTANVSVEIGNHSADAGSYINIAGDITDEAVIAAAAPRDADGSHYKFKVRHGKVEANPEIIKTGHAANDKAWFQMISFFGTDDYAAYMVGDTEARTDGEDNGQINVYINNSNGTNRATMDYHNTAVNGWTHDDGEAWWSRSGKWMSRGGGRRPTVHAMVLNGKEYAYFTTGTDWRNRGIMMDTEFKEGISTFPTFGFGLTTKEKNPDKKEGGMWLPYSFGCMADWYFDDEAQQGYVTVWSDRFGLHMFKVTCFE